MANKVQMIIIASAVLYGLCRRQRNESNWLIREKEKQQGRLAAYVFASMDVLPVIDRKIEMIFDK